MPLSFDQAVLLGAEEEACGLTGLDLSRRSCLGLFLLGGVSDCVIRHAHGPGLSVDLIVET